MRNQSMLGKPCRMQSRLGNQPRPVSANGQRLNRAQRRPRLVQCFGTAGGEIKPSRPRPSGMRTRLRGNATQPKHVSVATGAMDSLGRAVSRRLHVPGMTVAAAFPPDDHVAARLMHELLKARDLIWSWFMS
jgi:hypothetical protein